MARRFTLAEAQGLIPRVERLLQEVVAMKAEYDAAEEAIRASTERIMTMGGVTVDRESARNAKARLQSAAAGLRSNIDRVQELGCVLKDLDMGLVDFPTIYDGVEVYLCWRLGEPAIEYWHDAEEGFAGRKPIDQDFRDRHRGEPED